MNGFIIKIVALTVYACCSITRMVLTFTSCHFRSQSVLRPHLTHSCASRKLHRVFPNASLRQCRSVADSVAINLSFGYRIVVDGQISRVTRSCLLAKTSVHRDTHSKKRYAKQQTFLQLSASFRKHSMFSKDCVYNFLIGLSQKERF